MELPIILPIAKTRKILSEVRSRNLEKDAFENNQLSSMRNIHRFFKASLFAFFRFNRKTLEILCLLMLWLAWFVRVTLIGVSAIVTLIVVLIVIEYTREPEPYTYTSDYKVTTTPSYQTSNADYQQKRPQEIAYQPYTPPTQQYYYPPPQTYTPTTQSASAEEKTDWVEGALTIGAIAAAIFLETKFGSEPAPPPKPVYVREYQREDGVHVRDHYRSLPSR